ncbi:P1 family peptidase [Roseospira marina]|uniref:P1 family peptidase n=1 Tax=Roseospira marina TaxID=140057 RepID=A0A5M6I9Y5_9PROT|nr:P1 family peptidase [Roseospira marina]KAA5604993.1 P1 family peptidase [Roseospira marina]MBB4315002.1 L-aminopeptidase/D-esterase-like protein [Roseospira marina]MBB5088002.1 L-aminopeptidase/D-esterase-like protein [Roseospira marina]
MVSPAPASRPAPRPGPLNRLTDVPGLRVGHAHDAHVRTGVTVILPDAPATAAVDQRGGGPGTRETDLLDPVNTVEAVHALVLSGGSAFGLEAAGAVTTWLAGRGVGFAVGEALVPIVPSAILFDLLNGGDKAWGPAPPYAALGRQAVETARNADGAFALGTVGAAYGATAGDLKGGLGSASLVLPVNPTAAGPPFTVGALAAVNSLGQATLGDTPAFWAWPWAVGDELGPRARPAPDDPTPGPTDFAFAAPARANTTLVVVATDLALTKAQAGRVAIMAQDGLARALRPVHSPLDGDTVFALATGRVPLGPEPLVALARCGMAAADCAARAIARGVYEADSVGDGTSYRDRFRLR